MLIVFPEDLLWQEIVAGLGRSKLNWRLAQRAASPFAMSSAPVTIRPVQTKQDKKQFVDFA